MRRIILIAGVLCFSVLTGCKSDAEKAIDKAEQLSKEYIENLNNARTKEEIQRIRKEHKERASFELRKVMGTASEKEAEQKLKDSETSLKWEDIQRAKRIGENVEKAERNAVNRTYK